MIIIINSNYKKYKWIKKGKINKKYNLGYLLMRIYNTRYNFLIFFSYL
jgi:hypothetical protein